MILGCTKIPVLIKPAGSSEPIKVSAEIHARAAVIERIRRTSGGGGEG